MLKFSSILLICTCFFGRVSASDVCLDPPKEYRIKTQDAYESSSGAVIPTKYQVVPSQYSHYWGDQYEYFLKAAGELCVSVISISSVQLDLEVDTPDFTLKEVLGPDCKSTDPHFIWKNLQTTSAFDYCTEFRSEQKVRQEYSEKYDGQNAEFKLNKWRHERQTDQRLSFLKQFGDQNCILFQLTTPDDHQKVALTCGVGMTANRAVLGGDGMIKLVKTENEATTDLIETIRNQLSIRN